MLILIALAYFILACSAIWMVLFPAGRQFAGQVVGAVGRWRLPRWRLPPLAGAARWWRRQRKWLARHRALSASAAALVLVPTLLAIGLSHPGMLPGFESSRAVPDAQIAALLEGERLSPPAALPPLAFTTVEVTLVRPMLVDASRNWQLLQPDFSQRLLMAFKIMKDRHGYEMALLEGYRSPARQNLLASMGSSVTNAGAFQSWHQYGLAADCAFWRDGKLIISEKDPWAMRGYQLYGEVAESLGLTWGGRWTMMDFGHAELRMKGVMRK
ncbi:M15 family metallopeptidase [Massilia sp. DWR3-1-1]|uniref:M15 family metallopeptidase n=1 Tax=Massilia sp. DWR3-1-1 TaxID=2804559 RepID=UPI003CEDEBAD